MNHFNFPKQPIGRVTHVRRYSMDYAGSFARADWHRLHHRPRYAFVNVAGGVLAWWVLIPLLLFFDPDLPRRVVGERQRLRCSRLYALV